MDLGTAIVSVLGRYRQFDGRSRRSEYWYFTLVYGCLLLFTRVVDTVIGLPVLTIATVVALFVPALSVGARRLHDTDRSAWWLLLGAVPVVGWITLIVFHATDGEPGDNRFGPSPKYLDIDPDLNLGALWSAPRPGP